MTTITNILSVLNNNKQYNDELWNHCFISISMPLNVIDELNLN
jgi:hypothetical protein